MGWTNFRIVWVEARGHCKLDVLGCTIADNCESGLVCWSPSEVSVRNSILWRNGYELCGGGVNLAYQGQKIAVAHTLVGGLQLWPGEGNLNGDPLFEESLDYRLMPGSPAIDAGSPDAASDRDLEGHARPCGGGVDLGPYELGDCEPRQFRRGDTDGSGRLDLTDAVLILGYLFLGKSTPSCLDAADTDADGQLIVGDAIYLLRGIFLGGTAPPEPSAVCGADPTGDTVSCLENLGCNL